MADLEIIDPTGCTRQVVESYDDVRGRYLLSSGGDLLSIGTVWTHEAPGQWNTWAWEVPHDGGLFIGYERTKLGAIRAAVQARFPWKATVHS